MKGSGACRQIRKDWKNKSMLNPSELQFLTDNKEKIFDLIRAVDQHERIRAQIGPGNILGHPDLLPDYTRAHDIMSRLSQDLQARIDPHRPNIGPLDDHKDVPIRFHFTTTVAVSC